jgi:hypothetical protein
MICRSDSVNPEEEVHPLLSIGQLPHGRRLKRHERANHRRVVREDFQDNDSSGAGAEDGRGLVAHVLDQAPDIIGVRLEPTIVVLRPIEPAPGKAASIVGDNGVVPRQMFRHPFEAVGCAIGTRDHDHERAAAVGLKVEMSAGNVEDTHVPSFASL